MAMMFGTQWNEFDNLRVKFETTTLIRNSCEEDKRPYMEHYATDWTTLMVLQYGTVIKTRRHLHDWHLTLNIQKNENSFMYIWYTFKKRGFLTNKVPD